MLMVPMKMKVLATFILLHFVVCRAILAQTASSGTITYTYDALGRLVTTTHPSGPYTLYNYDNANNLTHTYSVFAGTDNNGNGIPDSWEYYYFGSTNVVVTNTDYNTNGIVDFLEYALGNDPTKPNKTNSITADLRSLSGHSYLFFTYVRNKFATQLTYSVQVSADLRTWEADTNLIEQVGVPIDNQDGTETLSVRCRTDIPTVNSLFLRLAVAVP